MTMYRGEAVNVRFARPLIDAGLIGSQHALLDVAGLTMALVEARDGKATLKDAVRDDRIVSERRRPLPACPLRGRGHRPRRDLRAQV
jgi:hypothetical protein